MSIYDDARDASEPLHNVVHDVLPGPFARYGGGLVVGGTPVTVLLHTDDPEAYRDQIESLPHEAGLANVRLGLRRNPLHT
jgi:hypothetical protein